MPKSRILAGVLVALAVVTGSTAPAATAPLTGKATASQAAVIPWYCKGKLFHRTKAINFARQVYQRPKVSKDARARMVLQRRCAYSAAARRSIRRKVRVFRNRHVAKRNAQGGGGGGGSPIPHYIVACESGGSYTAVNPTSGAYGKYQIMPFHWGSGGICSDLSRSPGDQDTCAARIWESSGPGAWECA